MSYSPPPQHSPATPPVSKPSEIPRSSSRHQTSEKELENALEKPKQGENDEGYDSGEEYPSVPFEIVLPNFPSQTPSRKEQTVWLERLWLSTDPKLCLHGSVAVSNIAFHKSVVCRFTWNHWETVDEASAEYGNEIPGSAGYERFNFSINLSDHADLESKTMYLCIRCTMDGQEHWESNDGSNFQVDFKKVVLPAKDSGVPETGTKFPPASQADDESANAQITVEETQPSDNDKAESVQDQVIPEHERPLDIEEGISELPSVDSMTAGQNDIEPGSLLQPQSKDGDDHIEDHDSVSVRSSEPLRSDKSSHTEATPLESGEEASMEPSATDQRSPVTVPHHLPTIAESKPEEGDIQSIASTPDDIAPLAGSNSSAPANHRAAIEYLVKALTADAELLEMYKEGASRLGEAKFVRDNRRLLKSYFLGLRAGAQTPAQKLAIRFLRHRNERVNISLEIYRAVAPSEIEMLPGTDQDEGVLRAPDEISEASDLSDVDSMDGDNEEGIQGVDTELSNLSSVAGFLTGGKPYGSYKDGFRRLLHSGSTHCPSEGDTQKQPHPSESPDAKATPSGETIEPVGSNGMDDEENAPAQKDSTEKPSLKNFQPSPQHSVSQTIKRGEDIHTIESSNQKVVIWIVAATILTSVVAGFLWSRGQSL